MTPLTLTPGNYGTSNWSFSDWAVNRKANDVLFDFKVSKWNCRKQYVLAKTCDASWVKTTTSGNPTTIWTTLERRLWNPVCGSSGQIAGTFSSTGLPAGTPAPGGLEYAGPVAWNDTANLGGYGLTKQVGDKYCGTTSVTKSASYIWSPSSGVACVGGSAGDCTACFADIVNNYNPWGSSSDISWFKSVAYGSLGATP